MVCLYCKKNTRVINSRPQKASNSVWRRRLCLNCQTIMTTHESLTLNDLILVEKNSRLEKFNERKLFLDIYQSLDHLDDQIQASDYLTSLVINKLIKGLKSPQITSKEILNLVVIVLTRYNKLAAKKFLTNKKHS
jgi:transcriptional repressor NrdR